MTDLEMIRLCAEAMGYREYVNPDSRARKPVAPCILVLKMDENATRELYDPLHDDAQAMALVKEFDLNLQPDHEGWCVSDYTGCKVETRGKDLNRAIVECVAKIQASDSTRRTNND